MKLTDEDLKIHAAQLLEKFALPADALPGESRSQYDNRKIQESLSNRSTAPHSRPMWYKY